MKGRIAGAALALLAAVPAAAQVAGVIHQQRSVYRNIFVTEEGGERCMLFRARHRLGRESCKFVREPDRHVFPYTQMMMAGLFLKPKPARILIVGLGGGIIPTTLRRLLPEAQIDVVELDPAVVEVAERFFDYRSGGTTRTIVQDGRVFVKRQMRRADKYDMVMLDAFEDDYIPEHMLTREFLQEVRAILAPTGVFVANTFSTSRLYPHESATYDAVFGRFYNMKADNRVIVGSLGTPPSAASIRANAAALDPALRRIGTSAATLVAMMSTQRDWPADTRVLTDQFSPANVLNAAGAR